MKKYRPLNAGYILVYVVVIAVIVQGIWTLIAMMLRQGAEAQNSLYGMLDMWTLILVPFAVIYGNHLPADGGRAFIHRDAPRAPGSGLSQGGREARLVRLPAGRAATMCSSAANSSSSNWPSMATRREFGLRPEDKSGAKTDARLFPVHEVAFIMQDRPWNCRMNAAHLQARAAARDVYRHPRGDGHRAHGKAGGGVAGAGGRARVKTRLSFRFHTLQAKNAFTAMALKAFFAFAALLPPWDVAKAGYGAARSSSSRLRK